MDSKSEVKTDPVNELAGKGGKNEKMDKFRAAALEQKRLLKLIADTDHAKPELTKCKMYIAELRNQIWDGSQKTSELSHSLDKEKLEFEEIQKSRVKRLAYVLGGQKKKHDSKVDKEEKEYLEALEKYTIAQARFKELERTMEEAKKKRTELEDLATKHGEYQHQIEELANSVFEGPSPGFLKEDEQEEQLQRAQEAYEELHATFAAEAKIVDGLETALSRAEASLAYLREAIKYCGVDIWGPTGSDRHIRSINAVIERALENAQQSMLEATIAANVTLANVGMDEVVLIKIPERHIVWNMILDCVFTEIFFREKLRDIEVDVEEFRDAIAGALSMFTPRYNALKEQTTQRHEELKAQRQELVEARMRLLEKVLEDERA